MNIRNYVFLLFAGILWFSPKTQAQNKISLDEVLNLSLEKNYGILIARNDAESAALDGRYAKAAFAPQVSATANKIWTNNNQKQTLANGTERESKGIKSTNQNAFIQLNWVLFDGLKMFVVKNRLEEITQQGALLVKTQVVNTIADVTVNYYNIVRQKQQLKAIQEQIAFNNERVTLAEKKLQVGTGSKPELLQARVDLNAQRTLVLSQQALIAQLKEQLNGLSGMQLLAEFDVSDTIPIRLDITQAYLADYEVNNPLLRVNRQNIAIAQLLLKERKAERFPVISFNSAYNYSQTDNSLVLNPAQALFTLNNGFNYGFSATIPLFNRLDNNRLVRQARLNFDYQRLAYDQEKLQVSISLRNAFVNYENAKKILVIEEENILLAKENAFIAMEVFKTGISNFIELRTAQQSLEQAYNRLIDARYNTKLAETDLMRISGRLGSE